jgi:hypothetical protein
LYVAQLDYDGLPRSGWRLGSDTAVETLNDMGVDGFRNIYVSGFSHGGTGIIFPFGAVNATRGNCMARALTVRL